MSETKDIILISGEDGEEGSKYKIIITMGVDSMEMSATIKNNDLPDSLTMFYEMPGVLNIMKQRHRKISEQKTLIINEQEFQFKGLMKIMAFFEPKGFNLDAFKAQSRIYLEAFKKYMEDPETNE